MGKGCREGVHPQSVLKTGKNPEKKIIRKKSNSMGKGCREGSHPQIVLKTGKNPEKKTKNNQKKIKQYGERMQGRFSSTDCSQNWQKP